MFLLQVTSQTDLDAMCGQQHNARGLQKLPRDRDEDLHISSAQKRVDAYWTNQSTDIIQTELNTLQGSRTTMTVRSTD